MSFDPIRTRVQFLGALTPAARKKFLADAEQALREEVRRARQLVKEARATEEVWDQAATEGALAVLRCRLNWIRSLRERVLE